MRARFSVSKVVLALSTVALVVGLSSGLALAAGAPVVVGEWSADVGYTTALLKAEIVPNELATTYRFEYGPDVSYGTSVPIPDGNVGAGSGEVEVSQQLSDVQAGTTYHYRVVATTTEGTTYGQDKSFITFPIKADEAVDTCPNAAMRVGLSVTLPDCRAYEMVSPVEKNGSEVNAELPSQTVASESGDRVMYMARTGFGDTKGSGRTGFTQYLAQRGSSAWTTKSITPTPNPIVGLQTFFHQTQLSEFTPDLSMAALVGYSLPENPEGARENSENLYLEDTLNGHLTSTVTNAINEGQNFNLLYFENTPVLGGASATLDVVSFMSRVNYLPAAHGSQLKAYVFEHGAVKLLGILPDGSVPAGGSRLVHGTEEVKLESLDNVAVANKDTVSADGSRILFEVPEFEGQLYMRKNGSTSVLITESETSEPVTAENIKMEAATPDLKHIVFNTSSRLLDSAPAGGGLYLYTDGPTPTTEGNLRYIGAGEQVKVLGMSDDGTHIYYEFSESKVMLWDSGQTTQIAPEVGASPDYNGPVLGEARVTPDGREIAFMDNKALTTDAELSAQLEGPFFKNIPNTEMYVYNEVSNSLKCVSCPMTGAKAEIGIETDVRATKAAATVDMPYKPRFLSQDGRYVFFNTEEALLPQDTNGVTDAYEYDTVTGRLSLVSSGTGEDGSWFVDASTDGSNVFIATHQRLTGWDPDKLDDLYDVRVDGGLPEPPAVPVPCVGDACQGTPSAAPGFSTASGFTGLGNLPVTAPAKVKAKTKPSHLLGRALAQCRKKPVRRRAHCRHLARKRYGPRKSAKHTTRTGR